MTHSFHLTRLAGDVDATDARIGIAVSMYNSEVTDGLLAGALAVLEAAGATEVTVASVPGAFELPLTAKRFATAGYDAVVALGAVIAGETDHYEHIAHRATEGLLRVSLEHDLPVALGVLTVQDVSDALARSQPGIANKGAEAAETAVRMLQTLQALRVAGRDAESRHRQRSRTI